MSDLINFCVCRFSDVVQGPVEEISALTVLHGDLWITTAIDDSDNIPIGLCTVRHEAFEVGILHAVLCHEIVEFSLHDILGLCVL
jgi:hypothetical protein